MKVLVLTWEYPPHVVGGLGKHVTELVPALLDEGVEIHLVTPRWAGGLSEETIECSEHNPYGRPGSRLTVYRVDPPVEPTQDFFTGVGRANRPIEQHASHLMEAVGDIDLIHVHDWLMAFAGIGLKHAYKVPLLATIHATEYGRQRGSLMAAMPRDIHSTEWWLTYEAWRAICCSHFMAQEIRTAFQTPMDKIDVIPNGVDTSRFDKLDGEDLTAFRRDYAAPDERLVLFVGRIVHEKGVHLLVEAMPHVLSEIPQTRLVITGTGGQAEAVRQLISDLGITDRVSFTGFAPDDVRDRLLSVADVAVFPSLYEPFGIVALEAMAARTPVVAAEVGGLAEVVRHGDNGVTVYPGDVRSLAWGITYTLAHPDLAKQRVANAYRMAIEEFNWRAIARRTLEVYRRVVAERRVTVWD